MSCSPPVGCILPALFLLAAGCPAPTTTTQCETWYTDADADGFGDPDAPVEVCDDAPAPSDVVLDATDCDDTDDAVNPDAVEVCATAGIDDDCDGVADDDEATGGLDHWPDSDGDGHGDAAGAPETSCAVPDGRAAVADDCDDAAATVFPGAPELCDGLANDCDAPNAPEGGATLGSGATFAGLAEALTAAVSGDEVRICGTHTGVFVATVPVHLVGEGGRDAVTLSGDDLGTVLTVPADSTVTGLTLTQGQGANGGGLLLSEPGALEVRDSTLLLNTARNGGGVFLPMGSTASFPGTRIEINVAESGGGIYAGPGTTIDLTDAVVDDNRADLGGGITATDVTLVGGQITDNDANEYSGFPDYLSGGGLLLFGDSSITDTEIGHNTSQASGGGISVTGSLDLIDVWIHDNDANYDCGGIQASEADLTLTGTSEVGPGNTGGTFGGGLCLFGGSMVGGLVQGNVSGWESGGMYANGAIIDGVEVRGNSASNIGGGIEMRSGTIRNCTVADNTANSGGGIFAESDNYGPVLIEDTVVTGNVANDYAGGGLYLESGNNSSPLEVHRVTVTDNVAPDGSAIHVRDDLVTVVDAVILRNLALDAGGGAIGMGSTFGGSFGPQISVTTSDLGTGIDDNAPADVGFADGTALHGWDVDATFTCNATTCTPLP